jgi:hypothetical protein
MHPSKDPNADRMRKLGRAVDDEVKYEMCQRLLAAWLRKPHQRLGQLINNALLNSEYTATSFFLIEDDALIQTVESFTDPSQWVTSVKTEA